VQFQRKLGTTLNDGSEGNVGSYGDDVGQKVLSITPGEFAISFSIDYIPGTLGGKLEEEKGSTYVPMEVNLQVGEWEVARSILKESIPYLLGWNTMMDIAVQDAVNSSLQKK